MRLSSRQSDGGIGPLPARSDTFCSVFPCECGEYSPVRTHGRGCSVFGVPASPSAIRPADCFLQGSLVQDDEGLRSLDFDTDDQGKGPAGFRSHSGCMQTGALGRGLAVLHHGEHEPFHIRGDLAFPEKANTPPLHEGGEARQAAPQTWGYASRPCNIFSLANMATPSYANQGRRP